MGKYTLYQIKWTVEDYINLYGNFEVKFDIDNNSRCPLTIIPVKKNNEVSYVYITDNINHVKKICNKNNCYCEECDRIKIKN